MIYDIFYRQMRKKVKSDPNGGVQLLTKGSKKLSQGTEMEFISCPTKKECRNLSTGRNQIHVYLNQATFDYFHQANLSVLRLCEKQKN